MNKLPLIMLLLVLPAVLSAQIYRWVDDDGTVHYSDQPVPGAEEIELREVDTYTPVLPQPYVRDAEPDAEVDPGPPYTLLRIVMPEDESVVWATGGLMQVLVAVDPALQSGHKIALYLNGAPVEGTPVADTVINTTGIIRGTHGLVAAVIDGDGNELLRSASITIHARAHSVFDRRRRR